MSAHPPPEPTPPELDTLLNDLLNNVLDVALEHHTDRGADGDTFTLCRVCQQWEDHDARCPVPAIERWLTESPR